MSALTLFAALMLAAAFIRARSRISVAARLPARWWLSAAAGVSIAYVFVEIVPELEVRRQQFLLVFGHDALFAERIIYLAALLGFVLFYGLNHMLVPSASATRLPPQPDAAGAAFWTRIAGYVVYGWLIGYVAVERGQLGAAVLVLYTVAMVLHVTVVGTALVRRHGVAYRRFGAWILAASVIAGWAVGVIEHVPDIVFSFFFAFVAGVIIMTSVSEDLPGRREGNFWWLVGGAAAYALILIAAAP